MRATDIIMKKRGIKLRDENNNIYSPDTTLSVAEIKFLIDNYVAGNIPDYQMSAFLMAVYFNGMTFAETGALTSCMLYSGDVISLHGKFGLSPDTFFVDKHSTGGVGDKISLPLAPIVAACGVKDPMMSGRALGHTGGTLDKLESIEGYNVNLDAETFAKFIAENGFAMMGQTPKIAPADKRLYALRDVTATVESIPLITASILSKKIAEGSDGLVFDVKWGSGAFMKTITDAEDLANSLVKTSQTLGAKATAVISDMNTPLGNTVGNFLEIEETILCLQGKGPKDIMELTYALGTEMILMSNITDSKEKALEMMKDAVASGKALELFLKNVKMQGGDPEKLLSQVGNRRSPFHKEIFAEKDGYLKMDAFGIGIASVYLGVGRNKTDDAVCPDAGFIIHKKTGDFVKKGDLILDVYGKDEASLNRGCEHAIENGISYSEKPFNKNDLIYKIIR